MVTGAPAQPLAVGVIVNVTVIGVVFVLVNAPLMLPLPLAAIPVTVPLLSLIQLNMVEGTVPVITIVEIPVPEHIDWEAGVARASTIGFMVIVAAAELSAAQTPLCTTAR